MTSMVPWDRATLLERVQKVAEALKSYFGARKVILFGSLAQGDDWGDSSDVDLAVAGLAAGGYWDAWWLAEEIIEDRPVDLVPVERATESVLRAIGQRGAEL
jgi:predicted nucleotidyltransferase